MLCYQDLHKTHLISTVPDVSSTNVTSSRPSRNTATEVARQGS
jgi:hypothetical protein